MFPPLTFRRVKGSQEDFNRDLNAYESGFGNLTGNFWMGLSQIFSLTNNLFWNNKRRYSLEVDIKDCSGNQETENYPVFYVSYVSMPQFSVTLMFPCIQIDNDGWALHVSDDSLVHVFGNAGDAFNENWYTGLQENGRKFSTEDSDWYGEGCPAKYQS